MTITPYTRLPIAVRNFKIERGEEHRCAKLTEEQVREIRRRALAGEQRAAIAADHGISEHYVSQLKLGRRWAHVPFEDGFRVVTSRNFYRKAR